MAAVDEIVLDPIEGALDSIGLMEGALAPAKRTALGLAIGAGIAFGFKPALSFDKDGMIRPWSMTSDAPNATPVPWWVIVGFPAFVLGVLI